VLHAYHAGAGNLRGVILKINPCYGGIDLIQQVWKTTYRGFQNASQNYSQLALAAFCEFDNLVMQPNDSVFMIDGDKMMNSYTKCSYVPYDKCNYLGECISSYETDLIDGNIPFDYFISKISLVENELAELAPKNYVFYDERYNEIGFQLLKVRNYDGAYKAFKLSETNNPNSWSAYHGLGETFRLMGKNELALLNYKKALFLNPNNEDSLRGIKRLPIK
jgi:tetratricopeptide (TPR) repeat protein